MEMSVVLQTSYTYKNVDIGEGYSVDEAKRFIKEVKPYIIGKPLLKVWVSHFYFGGDDATATETYPEYELRKQKEYHSNYNNVEWEGPLILLIGKNQLEIDLWQPDRYQLSFNAIELKNVLDTRNIPLKRYRDDFANKERFLDISCLYDSEIRGKNVTDIGLVCGQYEDGEEYFEKIELELENRTRLIIEDAIDSPSITVIKN